MHHLLGKYGWPFLRHYWLEEFSLDPLDDPIHSLVVAGVELDRVAANYLVLGGHDDGREVQVVFDVLPSLHLLHYLQHQQIVIHVLEAGLAIATSHKDICTVLVQHVHDFIFASHACDVKGSVLPEAARSIHVDGDRPSIVGIPLKHVLDEADVAELDRVQEGRVLLVAREVEVHTILDEQFENSLAFLDIIQLLFLLFDLYAITLIVLVE